MAQPSDLSDLLDKCTGGSNGTPEFIWAHKAPRTGAGAAAGFSACNPYSWWTLAGSPGHGVNPTSGTPRNPTNASDGTLKQADPSGGRKKWLVAGQCQGAVGTNMTAFFLADRLADYDGFVGNSTSLQTVTGGPLAVTRYTGTEAVGNQLFIEVYTLIGATPQTGTIVYENENGVSHTTTTQIGGNSVYRTATSFRPVSLAQGDRGIRSVTSIQLSGNTGAVGSFGFTIVRPLMFGCTGGAGPGGNCIELLSGAGPTGPVEVKVGAALYLFGWNTTTVMTSLDVGLQFVES